MPLVIPYENLNSYLYIDVYLGKSALVTETISQEAPVGSQIYKASTNPTTRIIGKDLFVYEDDTKARLITDFTYEPIQGWFFLDETVALGSIYVEYYRYTAVQQLPITDPEWDMPDPAKAIDIYNQPIHFDQPIFVHKLKFRVAHSDVELGKILIKQGVLDRDFFMIVDNNAFLVLQNTGLATALRGGFAYEGPLTSPDILRYNRGGPVTPEVTMFVHNFGDYMCPSMSWAGTATKAIIWRSNNPASLDIRYSF